MIRVNQPLQRQGMPIDVAYAALYLASERSAQVTGLVLPVDRGTRDFAAEAVVVAQPGTGALVGGPLGRPSQVQAQVAHRPHQRVELE